jgi:hypothetical protein
MPITKDELLLWAKTSNLNVTEDNKKVIKKVQSLLDNITEKEISLIMGAFGTLNANLLFISVANGNFRAINLLKEKLSTEDFNSLLFAKDEVGCNIFMYAMRHNLDTSFSIVSDLIADKYLIEEMLSDQDKYGHTVPMYALFATDYSKKEAPAGLVMKMLKLNMTIDSEKIETILSKSDKVGYTYLTWAVCLGCTLSVRPFSTYSEAFHNEQADKLAAMLMKNSLSLNFIASIEFFPEDFANKVAHKMYSTAMETAMLCIEDVIKKDNITDMKSLTLKEMELWNANPNMRPGIFKFIAGHKKWQKRFEAERYPDLDQVESKTCHII